VRNGDLRLLSAGITRNIQLEAENGALREFVEQLQSRVGELQERIVEPPRGARSLRSRRWPTRRPMTTTGQLVAVIAPTADSCAEGTWRTVRPLLRQTVRRKLGTRQFRQLELSSTVPADLGQRLQFITQQGAYRQHT
jgi:hypothetical protein